MKKGFTLVEIILSISLIVIIGVVSIGGFNLIAKKNKASKLEQINNLVLDAATVYIETNEETKNQLYEDKNGVVIPLKALVAEGLLDISGTTLEDSDIEDEYVVSAFTSTGDDENCINITTSTSWTLNKENPLYICTDSNGNSNLAILNPTKVGNKNAVINDIFYFRGVNVNNWIKINDQYSRILSVDATDAITIYDNFWWKKASNTVPTTTEIYTNTLGVNESMLNTIKGTNIFTKNHSISTECTYAMDAQSKIISAPQIPDSSYLNDVKVSHIYCGDIINSSLPSSNSGNEYVTFISYYDQGKSGSFYYQGKEFFSSSFTINTTTSKVTLNSNGDLFCSGGCGGTDGNVTTVRIKAQLKSCIKISGGTGTYENPYTITNNCS